VRHRTKVTKSPNDPMSGPTHGGIKILIYSFLTQRWIDKEAHVATTRSESVAAVTHRVPPLLAQQPEGYGHAVHVHGQTTES
jgi:hypothetical protein